MIMSFPNKLKQCRTQRQMTQQNIADILNVSRKTVSGWENGRSYPDVNLLISISDIFYISVDDLIRDDRMLSYYAEKESQNNKASLVLY
ncbi:helix-turn-helix transcriptional regulator [Levilactobacillus parabrevis]|uniref:helix-turn-helix transcriptional regulator n=2 Tax=Levilactobacillus parabrevis TaxID=357278 RepID=UPI0035D40719|nr:XRE family transcriptional regulator [Levilactobacillus parabrevis]MCT4490502.1 XRE family transcriptional regulator [Levilactobacillus parabrevis]